MADDGLPASQLRQRYSRGGEARDSELNASQLRARYDMKSNAADFSTRDNAATAGIPPFLLIAVALLLCAAVAAVVYFRSTQGH